MGKPDEPSWLDLYKDNPGPRPRADRELPRGVRQRENGSYVIELTIDGKRRPLTVKTREEAIRIKRSDAMRRRWGKVRLVPPPPAVSTPPVDLPRLPRGVRQRENGNY